MKKNIFLLFILLTLTVPVFAQVNVEERDAKLWANKVLYTVKKNDFEGFKKFVMVIQDWEKLLATMTKVPKTEKQEILAHGKEGILQSSPEKTFEKIQKAAKRDFVNWSQIKIESTAAAVEKKGHLKLMSFNIIFQFEGKSFSFSAKECVKTAAGWKISGAADLTLLTK